jgi:hypothetical protein
MKIYIAGAISGDEINAKKRFEEAERQLKKQYPSAEIVNPMTLPHDHDKTWRSYMNECITELVKCDNAYLIDGWMDSRGALLEFEIIRGLKINIIY